MNRIEIYSDDDIKVEIDKNFYNFLDKISTKRIKIERNQFEILIYQILAKLENKIDYENCSIVVSPEVPIIEYNKAIKLIDDFQILQIAFDYLSLIQNISSRIEVISVIEDSYKWRDIPFYIRFFEKEPYNKVSGFMAAKKDNKVFIALFSLPE